MKLPGKGGRASHMHTIAAESFLAGILKETKGLRLSSMLFVFSLVLAVTLRVCTEPKFLNFKGAQESTPKEPIPPGCVAWAGRVRQPYFYSVPSPNILFKIPALYVVCSLLQECKALLLSITLATLLPALTELLVRSTIPVGENLRSGRHTNKASVLCHCSKGFSQCPPLSVN